MAQAGPSNPQLPLHFDDNIQFFHALYQYLGNLIEKTRVDEESPVHIMHSILDNAVITPLNEGTALSDDLLQQRDVLLATLQSSNARDFPKTFANASADFFKAIYHCDADEQAGFDKCIAAYQDEVLRSINEKPFAISSGYLNNCALHGVVHTFINDLLSKPVAEIEKLMQTNPVISQVVNKFCDRFLGDRDVKLMVELNQRLSHPLTQEFLWGQVLRKVIQDNIETWYNESQVDAQILNKVPEMIEEDIDTLKDGEFLDANIVGVFVKRLGWNLIVHERDGSLTQQQYLANGNAAKTVHLVFNVNGVKNAGNSSNHFDVYLPTEALMNAHNNRRLEKDSLADLIEKVYSAHNDIKIRNYKIWKLNKEGKADKAAEIQKDLPIKIKAHNIALAVVNQVVGRHAERLKSVLKMDKSAEAKPAEEKKGEPVIFSNQNDINGVHPAYQRTKKVVPR